MPLTLERMATFVKTPIRIFLLTGLLALAPLGGRLWAGYGESATVESAAEVIQALSEIPLHGIPPALLQNAQGVAIIPNLLKVGFVVGARHGNGVVVVRNPDGTWSNPSFVSLTGGSFGWQIGVQSTDVVLVFRTRNSLARILAGKGKLTLGADVAVAAGPLGRQAEAGTDAQLKAEIFSYSRSRGLFAGLALEGAALLIDHEANEAYYHLRAAPGDLMTMQGRPVPVEEEKLRARLTCLSAPPPPPLLYPPPPPPVQSIPVPATPVVPVPVYPQPPPPPPNR